MYYNGPAHQRTFPVSFGSPHVLGTVTVCPESLTEYFGTFFHKNITYIIFIDLQRQRHFKAVYMIILVFPHFLVFILNNSFRNLTLLLFRERRPAQSSGQDRVSLIKNIPLCLGR